MEVTPSLNLITHDGVGHYPLGAGSYYFRDNLVGWLCKQAQSQTINIRIGAQPNSSPHMGNICNMATAFALGAQLRNAGKDPTVYFDAINTTPAPLQDGNIEVDGVTYQRSLR